MVGMSVINTIMGSSGGGLMSLFLTHLQAQYIDKTVHPYFLEHRNRQKILSDIRQCFSCLLDEGIAKKWLFLIHFIRFEMHMDRPDNLKKILGHHINYLSI